MGVINIPRAERDALKGVDETQLRQQIEQSLAERHSEPLRSLHLDSCGEYVAREFRAFDSDLAHFRAAKAARKVAETGETARRSGSDLACAVSGMKHQVEVQEREDQRFVVEDLIHWPPHFTERLSVRVNYQWRAAIGDAWQYGSITFIHEVDMRPDYWTPIEKRKLSAREQAGDQQKKLSREWEHLMRSALTSVRDFFRAGGDAADVPTTFRTIPDSYTSGLSNLSLRFWPLAPSQSV